MKKQLFAKQSLNTLSNIGNGEARSMCGCMQCSCKKNSRPKASINNAFLSVANIQGAQLKKRISVMINIITLISFLGSYK